MPLPEMLLSSNENLNSLPSFKVRLAAYTRLDELPPEPALKLRQAPIWEELRRSSLPLIDVAGLVPPPRSRDNREELVRTAEAPILPWAAAANSRPQRPSVRAALLLGRRPLLALSTKLPLGKMSPPRRGRPGAGHLSWLRVLCTMDPTWTPEIETPS